MATWEIEKEIKYGGKDPNAKDVDPYPDIPKQKKNRFSVKEMIYYTIVPLIIPQILFLLCFEKYKLIYAVSVVISLTVFIESVKIYIRYFLSKRMKTYNYFIE